MELQNIADFEISESMLRYFIKKVHNSRRLVRPRIVIAVPSGITEVERRAVKDSALHAGAREVHMGISSPPLLYPCYYGIDMATKKEFVANHKTIEDIRRFLNVDSLRYLSIDGLVRAVGESKDKFCFACFNGDYPVQIPENLYYDKFSLDKEEKISSNA